MCGVWPSIMHTSILFQFIHRTVQPLLLHAILEYFLTFPVILHSLVITPILASLKPWDVTDPLSVSTELTDQHGLNKQNHLIYFRIILSRIIHIVTCVSTSFILISSCIPSCECVTFCLSFFHYDIWIVSTF